MRNKTKNKWILAGFIAALLAFLAAAVVCTLWQQWLILALITVAIGIGMLAMVYVFAVRKHSNKSNRQRFYEIMDGWHYRKCLRDKIFIDIDTGLFLKQLQQTIPYVLQPQSFPFDFIRYHLEGSNAGRTVTLDIDFEGAAVRVDEGVYGFEEYYLDFFSGFEQEDTEYFYHVLAKCLCIGRIEELGAEEKQLMDKAYACSQSNRMMLEEGTDCGCYYCGKQFSSGMIRDWQLHRGASDETALCPFCGVDAVIGANSGIPIDAMLLKKLHTHLIRAKTQGRKSYRYLFCAEETPEAHEGPSI